ncbi:MAG TPA: alpha/beta hydrolase [Steroidobacteraceae bacterium]|nr:alpha/beta hydrolase [Steroidobacteraceae bacterium]
MRIRSPRRRGWFCALPALLAIAGSAGAAQPSLHVGGLTLHRCTGSRAAAQAGAWCGDFRRALDPHGTVAGEIPVYFEFYPHTAPGPARGMLVATEGGPGYPATESRRAYLALYAPLRAARDVLIMDNRGTGRSGAVDCPGLQAAPTMTEALVAECGQLLGARAPLYSTTLATDDLAALIEALAAGPVDLYGDSYGTFFAQVFALRHPRLLRSLVLDGAYPLADASYAWYPNYAPAMRDKFNRACARSSACAALPGDSMQHIAPALERLRAQPRREQAPDASGRLHAIDADATALAIVMYGSAPARASIRELDAAARAFVAGDRRPLLRLMAETQVGVDSRDATGSPEAFSAGLAAAVMCQDAPQVFDMRMPPAQRAADRDRIMADHRAHEPDSYAPFTLDEYRRMPLDYSFIDQCVLWPAPPAGWPPGQLAAPGTPYPQAPTLVVSGDLDNMTPVADGALAARNFPHGRQVVLRNSLHVNALPHARSDCGAVIVRRFIDTLDAGDAACAESVPAIRLVPRFARRVDELDPAVALVGNAADAAQLRAVTAAALAAGDALVRAPDVAGGDGVGLRGGGFSVSESAGAYRIVLRQLRWTEDLLVSGTVVAPQRSGAARARLRLAGAPALSGAVTIEWYEGTSGAQGTVHGTLGGRAVVARVAAP